MCVRRGLILLRHLGPDVYHGRRNSFASTRRLLSSVDTSYNKRVEALINKLHASVWTNHVADIHKCYPMLVADIKSTERASPSEPLSSPLNRAQILDILDVLAASGRSFDLALVERILFDMEVVFGLQPSPEDHTAVIRALIRYGNVQTIHRWLLTMSQKPGHLSPTMEQWCLFLEYCRERKELGLLRSAIKSMRKSGCGPTNETFVILIKALFETSPPVPQTSVFASIMDDMANEGLRYDPVVATALSSGYSELGHGQRASRVERMYETRFTQVKDEGKAESKWNQALREEVERHGVRAAVKICKTYQQDGFLVSSSTMRNILRDSTNASDLLHAEEELGIKANVVAWSILINNNVRIGDVSKALTIYSQSRSSGIRPDAAMVHPIINALCRTAIRPPSEAAIDQALTLYHDLAGSPHSPSNTSTSTNGPSSRGPDFMIYDSLLRALASSTNVTKYYPLAMSLLDDMRIRNITTGDSRLITSLTTLLMRNAANASEAFDIYQRMCKNEGLVLDAKGYAVVLNVFCKLSFPGEPLPSLKHYFEIAKDMRTVGHDMTAEVYTILLRQLAFLATQVAEKKFPLSFTGDLVAVIRRAHDYLTVDASISPDPPLWNQLMDTYQRAGCFEEAYKVWDMIYVSRRFDNVSVSIIFDACGYAGAWPMAKQICSKLLDDGFPFNRKNWNAWLECLCRLRKLNEAVRTLCLEMGKLQDDVAPDAESVRILLKFAIQTNQQNEVRSRIRRYLPKLWESLPVELRVSS